MYRVLIAEAEVASQAHTIRESLTADEQLSCHIASWSELAGQGLDPKAHDLVIVAAISPGLHREILEWLASQNLAAPVLAVLPANCGEETLDWASRAIDDFVTFPFSAPELRRRVGRLLEQPQYLLETVRRRLLEEIGLTNLVGRDPVFLRTVGQLPRFARSDAPVCITGETGTGKELCARALHHLSNRRPLPFIGVDCGALPEQLFENEMFGHARGAFTDAHRDHKGLIAMAEGGTLFLDEIDALSLASQAKLLRFLQERSFRPLGSDRFEAADVRIIAATNRDLEIVVGNRQFRSDLFFRLNVLRLRLPPLRERQGDVELLAYAALDHCSAVNAGPAPVFSSAALRALALYDWPGNVRELYNVVQRAVVASEGGRILPEHLELPCGEVVNPRQPGSDFRASRAVAVANFERRYVLDLLRKHKGNVTHAAREAQQDRRAFGRFIKKYNIDRRSLSA
ncbi:MAG TPA: sigma-54 dependent transcriptional regulator [Bryobacteraceae bacterium]|nr:sigma-54 dependent transcriptional regulator [Bryobacteraceae bacterium]